MIGLQKHIEELDQFLQDKGYNGYFLSAGGYPGKLKDSVAAFAESFIQGKEYGMTFPPALSTYCHWKDDRSGAVECRFILGYQEAKGFRINAVELESFDRYGFSEKKKTIPVSSSTDIPTSGQGRIWGLEPEKNKNINKKSLKF